MHIEIVQPLSHKMTDDRIAEYRAGLAASPLVISTSLEITNTRRTRALLTIHYAAADFGAAADPRDVALEFPDAEATLVDGGRRIPISWCEATVRPEFDVCTALTAPCAEVA